MKKCKKSKKEKILEVIPYLIIFVMAILVFSKVGIMEGDDQWFYDAVKNVGNGSYLAYLEQRFFNWTGRIVVEAIMVPLIHANLWIWRILNSLILVVFTYGVYNLIPRKYLEQMNCKSKIFIKLLIGISIYILSISVFFWGVRWITGSFNYIWPIALGIIAILPFKYTLFNEDYSKKFYVMCYIVTILAANSEQISLVILCFGIVTNIFIYMIEKKIDLKLVIYNIYIGINTLILFIAPGNYVRELQEATDRYPGWDEVSIVEKILRGINLLVNHLVNESPIFLLFFLITLCVLINKRCKKTIIKIIAHIITGIFSIIPMLNIVDLLTYNLFGKNIILLQRIRERIVYSDIGKINLTEINNITISLGIFIVILLVAVLIIFAFDKIKEGYIIFILYMAALAATISIGMSPTMYISGARVFMVTDILFIIIITLMNIHIVNNKLYKKMVLYIVFALWIIISITRWIHWAFIY